MKDIRFGANYDWAENLSSSMGVILVAFSVVFPPYLLILFNKKMRANVAPRHKKVAIKRSCGQL
jgi:hypothetical protein